ncbi:MAG: MBL fold metallo-hydrolase [Candidatus Doudnabacteria bacterium]|nr:MBL fold metallo-hydrolase [Candidatus Doudnabacteria bacterium]
MVITWFGLSCFKISSGTLTVVTDPFSKNVGLTAPRVATDVAIISNIENPAYNNRESLNGKDTFVVDGPGEFDVKGLFVRGIPGQGATIYTIRMEDIRLGFLGSLKQKELTESQLSELEDINILFVPVGGKTVCDAEEAVVIVNQIEPRFVIPMHYEQKGLKMSMDKVDRFLKEMGTKPAEQEKLTIKKSDLLGEQTEVVVLSPQR